MKGEFAMCFTVRFLERTNDRDLAVSQMFVIEIIAVLFGYYIIPHALHKKIGFLSFEIYDDINDPYQIT